MDFFERIFGVSPDGGSGTLEFIVMAVLVLIVASAAAYRRWGKRASVSAGAR